MGYYSNSATIVTQLKFTRKFQYSRDISQLSAPQIGISSHSHVSSLYSSAQRIPILHADNTLFARPGPNDCHYEKARYRRDPFAPHHRVRSLIFISSVRLLFPKKFPRSASLEAWPAIGAYFFERVDRLGWSIAHRHQFGDVGGPENFLLGRALQLHDGAIKVTAHVQQNDWLRAEA